jgi:hypothetical protein
LRIDLRGTADSDRFREYAAELVKLSPNAIVTGGVVPTKPRPLLGPGMTAPLPRRLSKTPE